MRWLRKLLGPRSVKSSFLISFIAVFVLLLLMVSEAQPKLVSGGLYTGPKWPVEARLVKGKAIPPHTAPKRVKGVIRAANKIRNKPYLWGGGHSSWHSSGYDCSGAVSFALRGGKFVADPMTSGSMAGWGQSGRGDWITVYANSGHAYMIVAGLRFDTANNPGDGPRWSKSQVSIPGTFFTARHPKGY